MSSLTAAGARSSRLLVSTRQRAPACLSFSLEATESYTPGAGEAGQRGGTHRHQPVVTCNDTGRGRKQHRSVGRQTHSSSAGATHPCPHACEDAG